MQTRGAAAATINLTELMDNSRIGPLQVRVFALCLASLIMDGFDVQAMGFVATAVLAEWGVRALGARRPCSRAANFGVLLGALVFSMVADKIGRRPVLVWATLFFCGHDDRDGVCAEHRADCCWLRFIAGIGLGCIIPNATALVGEFSPKTNRVSPGSCASRWASRSAPRSAASSPHG